VLEDAIDRKMQNVWAAPLVRSVKTLEKFNDLIPPVIRQHYEDIVGGGSGYHGYRRAMPNVEDAPWDWQVHMPCSIGGNDANRLPIRCTGGFFVDEFVEIGEPCLWIFDYMRDATRGDDVPWTVEYGKVLQQLQRWMASVHRWNAIFLLHVGLFFEEKMRETFAMSGGCT
jgi:hypothetical protein